MNSNRIVKVEQLSDLVRDFSERGREKLLQFYHQSNFHTKIIIDKNKLYHALLFNLVYPYTKKEKEYASKFIEGIRKWMDLNLSESEEYLNSGLPDTPIEASFSFQMSYWIINSGLIETEKVYSNCRKSDQMELITPFLNKTQQEFLSEENLSWKGWCKYLNLDEKNYLQSILTIFYHSKADVVIKEMVFKRLQVFIRFRAKLFQSPGVSSISPQYYKRLIKNIQLEDYIGKSNFLELKLEKTQLEKVVNSAKINLLNLCKETDPITNADVLKTKVLIKNETTICLFYLKKDFQLKNQLYVGYMVYRNQIPVAYGGGWCFKKQIRFGLNILPFVRGGESQKILADILSCYKKLFKPNVFLIDAYQIGKNNLEAINSGAFWFYYKLGFRSVKHELNNIAQKEFQLLKLNKAHKTTTKTLKKLTFYPLYLGFKQNPLNSYTDISTLK
jgi:hypothetical protein